MAYLKRRVDTRQGFGVLLLALVLVSVIPMTRTEILGDLNGTLGMYLALAIGLLVPRKWLTLTFCVIAAYFFFMSGWWLFLDLTERSKNGVSLPIAFALAAIIFVACAVLERRKAARLSP